MLWTGVAGLLESTYRSSGVAPSELAYVEAHGTGTQVGDPIEAQALGQALGRQRSRPLLIGSAKTNLGHLEPAAGMAGLLKVILALQHREVPLSLHLREPNPAIPFEKLNLHVVTEATPLADAPEPLMMGVSAYGFLRKNLFHGHWFKRCGWWPDRVVRLVNRRKGRFSEHLVHEQWTTDGQVRGLSLPIEHVSFRNYADLIEKMQNYSSLAAREMEAQGRNAGWWTPISHGMWTFLRWPWMRSLRSMYLWRPSMKPKVSRMKVGCWITLFGRF